MARPKKPKATERHVAGLDQRFDNAIYDTALLELQHEIAELRRAVEPYRPCPVLLDRSARDRWWREQLPRDLYEQLRDLRRDIMAGHWRRGRRIRLELEGLSKEFEQTRGALVELHRFVTGLPKARRADTHLPAVHQWLEEQSFVYLLPNVVHGMGLKRRAYAIDLKDILKELLKPRPSLTQLAYRIVGARNGYTKGSVKQLILQGSALRGGSRG